MSLPSRLTIHLISLVGFMCILQVCQAAQTSKNLVEPEKSKGDFVGKEREKFSIETWEPPAEIAKNYPYYLSGYDSEDRAIIVLLLGKWDTLAMVKKGGQGWIDLQHHAEKMLYHLKTGSFRKNYTATSNGNNETLTTADDIVMIVDWDDFKLIQLFSPESVAFTLKYIGQMERFQEKIAYGFFVNVNPIANAAVIALRPTLGRFMERIEIFGTQRSTWIPILRRHLPEEQISPNYGGLPNFKPVAFLG